MMDSFGVSITIMALVLNGPLVWALWWAKNHSVSALDKFALLVYGSLTVIFDAAFVAIGLRLAE